MRANMILSPRQMRRRRLLLLALFYLVALSALGILPSISFTHISHLLIPLHPRDLSLSKFQIDQTVQLDKTHHSYKATISLKSLQSKTPLSALQGSVTDGQTRTLSDLLGKNNTSCITATLLVNHAEFDVQPSLTQEYSLEQSQVTWVWNITFLHPNQQTQVIPVLIDVAGKSHCRSEEVLQGPYHLAKDISLTITVPNTTSVPFKVPPPQSTAIGQTTVNQTTLTSSQGVSAQLSFLIGMFLALMIIFLIWLSTRFLHLKREETAIAEESLSIVEVKNELSNPDNIEKAQSIQKPISLFYCYDSEDKRWCNQLDKQLSTLKYRNWITSWSESKITPGTIWEEETTKKLETSCIILLLISPDFMNSQYRYSTLMARAIERHEAKEAIVVPVILRPCMWDITFLQSLAPLPTEGKPVSTWTDTDEAFLNIALGIRKVVESLQATSHET